ncbi:MAG: hypothetical protein JWN94_4801 [Betaproteobacteria bacterium]|nr:hypothetical protein [Betaproteobacteria bacterium]
MISRDERPVSAVPRGVIALLAAGLALQIAWQSLQPKPVARAVELGTPPTVASLRVASLGEPVALAQLMTLYLQAFDNQPGVSIPFRNLDYGDVAQWLAAILSLDTVGQYPLLMAAQIYTQVPDTARERLMIEFVHAQFLQDPNRRWRWLAHVTIMAKHRLHDDALALRYARDLARLATAAPNWARQMQIFILEDIGELESAKILLGGLLASGEIKDERELHFLTERLEGMKNDEKQTSSTKSGRSQPPALDTPDP